MAGDASRPMFWVCLLHPGIPLPPVTPSPVPPSIHHLADCTPPSDGSATPAAATPPRSDFDSPPSARVRMAAPLQRVPGAVQHVTSHDSPTLVHGPDSDGTWLGAVADYLRGSTGGSVGATAPFVSAAWFGAVAHFEEYSGQTFDRMCALQGPPGFCFPRVYAIEDLNVHRMLAYPRRSCQTFDRMCALQHGGGLLSTPVKRACMPLSQSAFTTEGGQGNATLFWSSHARP